MKKSILIFILVIAFPILLHAKSKGTTAIMVATDSEFKAVMSMMKSIDNKTGDGIIFIKGKFNGQPVILAKSNTGKINAAYTTTLLFERFEPERLIVIGLAGALNPKIKSGSAFIANRVIEHDHGELLSGVFGAMQNEGIDVSKSPLFNAAMSGALSQGISLTPAVLLTGDTFISTTAKRDQLRKTYGGDIVDMEGYAAAKICELKKKDCAILKVTSDSADEKAHKVYEESKSGFDNELTALLRAVLKDQKEDMGTKKQPKN